MKGSSDPAQHVVAFKSICWVFGNVIKHFKVAFRLAIQDVVACGVYPGPVWSFFEGPALRVCSKEHRKSFKVQGDAKIEG